MEKYTNEELLEFLPKNVQESDEFTTKQKAVLGQVMIYNGLEQTKENGFFYRSNHDLCNDCGIQEKTLIAAVRKLESLGLIDRKKGNRACGASEYRVDEKLIGEYCKKKEEYYSKDYSKQMAEMADRIRDLEITVKELQHKITVMEGGNYSTDTEPDTDKELEIEKEIYNNINNNIEIDESFENSVKEEAKEEENEPPGEVPATSSGSNGNVFSQEELKALRELNNIVNPFLLKVQIANSVGELEGLEDCLLESVREHLSNVGDCPDTVLENVSERVASALEARKEEMEELKRMEISKQIEYQRRLAGYY